MVSYKQILRKIGKNSKLIEEAEIKRIKSELSENVEDSSLDFCCMDLDFASSKRLLDEAMRLVDKAMNESLTISSDVSSMVRSVGNKIIADIPIAEPIRTADGHKIRKGYCHFENDSIDFDVDWTVHYMVSKYGRLEGFSKGSVNPYCRRITVDIFAIDGTVNKVSLFETLQHEIFHLFERGKRKKEYLGIEAYNYAYSKIKNKQPDDEAVETIVNRIIYISFTFEQRAFTNGAYQILMNGSLDDYNDKFGHAIKQTKLFDWLMICKKYKRKLQDIPEGNQMLRNALNDYGLSKSDILEIVEDTIDSIIRLLGRVRAKALIDYQKLHQIFEYAMPSLTIMRKKDFEKRILNDSN